MTDLKSPDLPTRLIAYAKVINAVLLVLIVVLVFVGCTPPPARPPVPINCETVPGTCAPTTTIHVIDSGCCGYEVRRPPGTTTTVVPS